LGYPCSSFMVVLVWIKPFLKSLVRAWWPDSLLLIL